MSAAVALGLDIGGTWTRALVVGVPDGARLGTSRQAGANPTTHGVDAAAARIEAAVAESLAEAGLDAHSVSACVVGMAGASKLAGDPAAAGAIAALWRRIGLRCPVEIVADVTAAFASGSPAPDGSILLAGTGAIAATISGRRPVGILGGHGWLLGDEGSGFWIGRQAVRAVLRELDDGGAPSALTAAVLAELTPATDAHGAPSGITAAVLAELGPATDATDAPGKPDPSDYGGAPSGLTTALLAELTPATNATDASTAPGVPGPSDFGLGESRRLVAAVIAAANARPPIHLAALAPLVFAAAEQGDPGASHILHEAADLLVATLARARDVHGARGARAAQDPNAPIVLAGGILAPGSPVSRLVLTAVTETWPKATIIAGVDGTAGAAWLAAHRLLGEGPDAAALHTRLLPGANAAVR